jgi:hypothetical protein
MLDFLNAWPVCHLRHNKQDNDPEFVDDFSGLKRVTSRKARRPSKSTLCPDPAQLMYGKPGKASVGMG